MNSFNFLIFTLLLSGCFAQSFEKKLKSASEDLLVMDNWQLKCKEDSKEDDEI